MLSQLNYRHALKLFRLGSEVLGKIPSLGDGPIVIAAKLLSLAEAVDKVYGGRSHVFESIFSKYQLKEKASEPFVRLFFDTKMAEGFKVTRIGVDEHHELIEALAPDGERLFFQQTRYSRPEIASEFFHTPGFNFSLAMTTFWDSYPHGIFLSVKPSRHGWGTDVTFTPMKAPRADLVSRLAEERLVADVAEHQALAGEPWCFIAYGPPGVGKTSHIVRLANATGRRLLRIDASSLSHIGVEEIGFIFDALSPQFVLFDDIDEAPVKDVVARLRFLFEHIHDAHAGVTLAVTVNDATKLDEALFRSERIDQAKEFTLPAAAERLDIVTRLAAVHLPGRLDEALVREVVEKTEGFNHSDVRAFVMRLRRKTLKDAYADIQSLRALAAASAAEKKKATEEKAEAASPPSG